ncbi:MAG: hypothetical protein IPM92_04955 [Saprospiraceae bacterium]|nr:hypothetical protein [Saprospiraceae bacterium]
MIQAFIYIFCIFALFVGFNIYIRVKTFKFYKQLVDRRIQFHFKDIFSKLRWEKILAQYPDDIDLLNRFRKHMLTTGLLFVCVIILVFLLLFFMRNIQ